MSQLYAVLTLLRLFAFMVVIYVGLGWLVERRSRNPESKLRAFFRIVCAPVNRLVARQMAPGAPMERVYRVSFLAVLLIWIVLIVAHQLLRPEG